MKTKDKSIYPAWCQSEKQRKLYRGMTGIEEPVTFNVADPFGITVLRPEIIGKLMVDTYV